LAEGVHNDGKPDKHNRRLQFVLRGRRGAILKLQMGFSPQRSGTPTCTSTQILYPNGELIAT